MSGHTPGPWESRTGRSAHAAIYVRGSDCNVAVGVLPRDAALIAAAPDLLAALAVVSRCVADDQGGVTLGNYEMSIVRAALAKAAGGA